MSLFALLRLAGHLPVPGLDAFLLHGQRSVDIVQFKVQAAGVAHRVPVGVSPPQRRRCRLTVRARRPCPPGCGQPPFGFDERAILPVHLVIESAGVTQIVTRTVPPPQRSRRGPAVHTLSTF